MKYHLFITYIQCKDLIEIVLVIFHYHSEHELSNDPDILISNFQAKTWYRNKTRPMLFPLPVHHTLSRVATKSI